MDLIGTTPMNAPNALTPPRWFVVDDEAPLLSLATMMLRQFSLAEVRACADPREALGYMTATPAGLELVVTDLNMPGMSGLELARMVREFAPQAKVLLTTGNPTTLPGEQELRARAPRKPGEQTGLMGPNERQAVVLGVPNTSQMIPRRAIQR